MHTVKNIVILLLLLVILGGSVYYFLIIEPQQENVQIQSQVENNAQQIEQLMKENEQRKKDISEMRVELGLQVSNPTPTAVPSTAASPSAEPTKKPEASPTPQNKTKEEQFNDCFEEKTKSAQQPQDYQNAIKICEKEVGYTPIGGP